MELFNQVAASLPTTDVWAHSKARRRFLSAGGYIQSKQSKPALQAVEASPEPVNIVEKEPEPEIIRGTVPPFDEWFVGLRDSLLAAHICAEQYLLENPEQGTKPEKEKIKLSAILKEVSFLTGVNLHDMRSSIRRRHVSYARFIYFYRARTETNASFPQIGNQVNVDHTTVLHGVRRYQELFGDLATKAQRKVAGDIITSSGIRSTLHKTVFPKCRGGSKPTVPISLPALKFMEGARD